MSQKRGKVFTWPVSAIATLKAKGILLLEDRKCELSAKVRLTLVAAPAAETTTSGGFHGRSMVAANPGCTVYWTGSPGPGMARRKRFSLREQNLFSAALYFGKTAAASAMSRDKTR
jgi:hypothetical protein